MSLLQARLAKLRDYSECFRIRDPLPEARERLLTALVATRLRCLQGDRYHQIGGRVDKVRCVTLLTELYRRRRTPLLTVGMADGAGDQSVLRAVDWPIVIRHHESQPATVPGPNAAVTVTERSGVAGSVEAIADVVHEHGRDHQRLHASTTR
jgi:predicted mannosyl-3-phosphoglycerate phosphatase (HAD superfamily)